MLVKSRGKLEADWDCDFREGLDSEQCRVGNLGSQASFAEQGPIGNSWRGGNTSDPKSDNSRRLGDSVWSSSGMT